MLVRAICRIEGFRYRNEGRLHGVSSERRFLHVTTQLVTQGYLDSLAQDLGPDQSLLVYCTRRSRGLHVPDDIEVKKIPRDLLEKCDFEEDRP
jgi:adenine-specific DNA-methyltransferase